MQQRNWETEVKQTNDNDFGIEIKNKEVEILRKNNDSLVPQISGHIDVDLDVYVMSRCKGCPSCEPIKLRCRTLLVG